MRSSLPSLASPHQTFHPYCLLLLPAACISGYFLLNSTIRASSAVSELVVTIVVCFSTSTSTSQRVLVHSCSRAESSGARRFPSLADSVPIVVRWPRLSPAGPNGLCGVSLFSSFALLFLSHLASSSSPGGWREHFPSRRQLFGRVCSLTAALVFPFPVLLTVSGLPVGLLRSATVVWWRLPALAAPRRCRSATGRAPVLANPHRLSRWPATARVLAEPPLRCGGCAGAPPVASLPL